MLRDLPELGVAVFPGKSAYVSDLGCPYWLAASTLSTDNRARSRPLLPHLRRICQKSVPEMPSRFSWMFTAILVVVRHERLEVLRRWGTSNTSISY